MAQKSHSIYNGRESPFNWIRSMEKSLSLESLSSYSPVLSIVPKSLITQSAPTKLNTNLGLVSCFGLTRAQSRSFFIQQHPSICTLPLSLPNRLAAIAATTVELHYDDESVEMTWLYWKHPIGYRTIRVTSCSKTKSR